MIHNLNFSFDYATIITIFTFPLSSQSVSRFGSLISPLSTLPILSLLCQKLRNITLMLVNFKFRRTKKLVKFDKNTFSDFFSHRWIVPV